MKLGTAYSTFVLISALALTGCGADDDTAPSASDAPTSSSSTSTSTSSAQAKAGEYQPATENGPAQNVPRPQKPEGMDVESVEGLEKFLNYWFEMRDYAMQTGDINTIFPMVESYYQDEHEFYKFASQTYKNKGWIVSTGEKAYLNLHTDQVESNGDSIYAIKANFYQPSAIVYNQNGEQSEEIKIPDSRQKTFEFIARYQDGEWTLVNIEEEE